MGRPYEGSLAEFVDQIRGWELTLDELEARSKAAGKPYSRTQLRRSVYVVQARLSGKSGYAPRIKGPGAAVDAAAAPEPKKRGRPPVEVRLARALEAGNAKLAAKLQSESRTLMKRSPAAAVVTKIAQPKAVALAQRKAELLVSEIEDEGPPPKHTAMRKLILDIGLEAAEMIFEEFKLISERMR